MTILAHKIFKRESSTLPERSVFFRKLSRCLSRGYDKRALDKFIGRSDLHNIDWDSQTCELRLDMEALAVFGQNTCAGMHITTVAKDKRP